MLGNTSASIKSTCGTNLGIFLVPILVTTGWFLLLTKVFQNDYVAACSTASRRATEKIETGGCVTVPCLPKMTEHNSTADWLKI